MNAITVIPNGGLGNRLRVILSYLFVYKKINVLWKKTSEIAYSMFLDVFEPIQGICFVDRPLKTKESFSTCFPHAKCDWFGKDGKELIKLIKPKPFIQETINAIPTPDIAVHVRRTDHVLYAKAKNNFTPDKLFFDFIDENVATATSTITTPTIFVATDNSDTYSLFSSKYNVIQMPAPLGSNNRSKRNTSTADSVVDWFVCAKAIRFMGTNLSSFTDLIMLKR